MNKKIMYALGVFDGVHLGHQALLRACMALAETAGAASGVVTFSSHPDGVVLGAAPKLILTQKERRRILEEYGIQNVVELPFDRALMQMPWQAFVQMLQREYGAAGFVCGSDFRFGFRGEGTAEVLQTYCRKENIPCTVVPEQTLDGTVLSSTYIRTLLENGEMARVNRCLGRPYTIAGTVVAGRQLGRTLGVPTANICLAEELICPKLGVYATQAVVNGVVYPAVTNIGSRPTVGGHQVRAESWLLDFDGDLYGKEMQLRFAAYLRPEEKFPSLEDLVAEIRKDAEKTRKILGKY